MKKRQRQKLIKKYGVAWFNRYEVNRQEVKGYRKGSFSFATAYDIVNHRMMARLSWVGRGVCLAEEMQYDEPQTTEPEVKAILMGRLQMRVEALA